MRELVAATWVVGFAGCGGWLEHGPKVLQRIQGLGYGSLDVSRLEVRTADAGDYSLSLVGQSQAVTRQVIWDD